jgi:hypothetical protein
VMGSLQRRILCFFLGEEGGVCERKISSYV